MTLGAYVPPYLRKRQILNPDGTYSDVPDIALDSAPQIASDSSVDSGDKESGHQGGEKGGNDSSGGDGTLSGSTTSGNKNGGGNGGGNSGGNSGGSKPSSGSQKKKSADSGGSYVDLSNSGNDQSGDINQQSSDVNNQQTQQRQQQDQQRQQAEQQRQKDEFDQQLRNSQQQADTMRQQNQSAFDTASSGRFDYGKTPEEQQALALQPDRTETLADKIARVTQQTQDNPQAFGTYQARTPDEAALPNVKTPAYASNDPQYAQDIAKQEQINQGIAPPPNPAVEANKTLEQKIVDNAAQQIAQSITGRYQPPTNPVVTPTTPDTSSGYTATATSPKPLTPEEQAQIDERKKAADAAQAGPALKIGPDGRAITDTSQTPQATPQPQSPITSLNNPEPTDVPGNTLPGGPVTPVQTDISGHVTTPPQQPPAAAGTMDPTVAETAQAVTAQIQQATGVTVNPRITQAISNVLSADPSVTPEEKRLVTAIGIGLNIPSLKYDIAGTPTSVNDTTGFFDADTMTKLTQQDYVVKLGSDTNGLWATVQGLLGQRGGNYRGLGILSGNAVAANAPVMGGENMTMATVVNPWSLAESSQRLNTAFSGGSPQTKGQIIAQQIAGALATEMAQVGQADAQGVVGGQYSSDVVNRRAGILKLIESDPKAQAYVKSIANNYAKNGDQWSSDANDITQWVQSNTQAAPQNPNKPVAFNPIDQYRAQTGRIPQTTGEGIQDIPNPIRQDIPNPIRQDIPNAVPGEAQPKEIPNSPVPTGTTINDLRNPHTQPADYQLMSYNQPNATSRPEWDTPTSSTPVGGQVLEPGMRPTTPSTNTAVVAGGLPNGEAPKTGYNPALQSTPQYAPQGTNFRRLIGAPEASTVLDLAANMMQQERTPSPVGSKYAPAAREITDDERANIANAISDYAQGDSRPNWVEPVLFNAARAAWYQESGGKEGTPEFAPRQYIEDWTNSFLKGETKSPYQQELTEDLRRLGKPAPVDIAAAYNGPQWQGKYGLDLTVAQNGKTLEQETGNAKYAGYVCGPIAFQGLARAAGKDISLSDVIHGAERDQILSGLGMNDAANGMAKLAQQNGVGVQVQNGVNQAFVDNALAAGSPVIINSQDHYFLISGKNPDNGLYYVGSTGAAVGMGKELPLNQIRFGGPATQAIALAPGSVPQNRKGEPVALSLGGTRQTTPSQVGTAIAKPGEVDDTGGYDFIGGLEVPKDDGKINTIRSAAQEVGYSPTLLTRQLAQEGAFSNDVWNGQRGSGAGARGPGQFITSTGNAVADQMGIPRDKFWATPELQVRGAAFHMKQLLQDNNGDYPRALAAYNAGQGNVNKYGDGVFDADFARGETRDYVNNILGRNWRDRRGQRNTQGLQ